MKDTTEEEQARPDVLPEPLQPGDLVSYTIVRQSGRSIRFSSREGTLIAVETLGRARVKGKNGQVIWVRASDLRLVGKQNALTENFLKMASSLETED
jgi:hypothetical protein